MKPDNAELLNIIQQVLRGVVTAAGALHPEQIDKMSSTLGAFAMQPDIDPAARAMLQDLAQGPAMIAAARQAAPKH